MMKDLSNNIGVVMLLEGQSINHVNTVSSILDTAQYDKAEIQVMIGTLTGVDGSNYLTPVLQESDTIVGTDFTNVSASDIIGGFSKVDSTAKHKVIQRAGYVGSKRYIRVSLVYTGTGITAGVVAVTGIVSNATYAPVVSPTPITAT